MTVRGVFRGRCLITGVPGVLGTPGEFVGAGEWGADEVLVGTGVSQTGSTELRASSSI